jgi:hypothetical protein
MSTVEIDGVQVANFTIVIKRGGVFIDQWSFLGSSGTPDATLDAKIVVEPRGAASEEWNSSNGRFTNVSTGTYLLNLDEAYTTAITWDFANYHVYVVESSGNTVPCITSGFVFVENC